MPLDAAICDKAVFNAEELEAMNQSAKEITAWLAKALLTLHTHKQAVVCEKLLQPERGEWWPPPSLELTPRAWS